MALKFTPSTEAQAAQAGAVTTDVTVTAAPLNIQTDVPQEFSITAKADELKQELVKNEAVDKLVSTININDVNSIVKFGNEVAMEISKASDQVLNSMNMDQINDSGELLQHLSAVMDQFDAKELTEEPKKGVFANLRKQVDKLLAKYHTMGDDVDKIYVQLRQYETEIEASNVKLETMFNANIQYYKDLLLYIMAGEQACVELDQYIADYRKKLEAEPDSGAVAMEIGRAHV